MKQADQSSLRTSRRYIQRNGVKDSLFMMQGLAEAELAELCSRRDEVNVTSEVEDALTASLKDAMRVIEMIQHFRLSAEPPVVENAGRTGHWSSVPESVYQVLHAMTYECPFNNITILKILPHTLPEIPLAQVHLDSILFQLAANARRNIGDSSGIITIEAEAEVTPQKTFFKLRVSDTGPGVPLSEMDQIFDPLVVRDGRLVDNIALCLVRKLVEVNNGRIHVVSNARGASFIMQFEF